ncbi:MAG: lysylphosphatidylglycerol synthase transmembrane domain-containing protein [Bacteroidales bacterium]
MSKAKLHKTYNLALKAIILILAYYMLYYQIFKEHNPKEMIEFLSREYAQSGIFLPIMGVFLMMFLNWGTESLKWQFLIRKNEKISYLESIKGVFSGVTISSMTPNRVGEYLGRVFILKKTHPLRGILITIVGSISQLLVTITLGSVSLLYLLILFPEKLNLHNPYIQISSIVIVLLIWFLLAGLYFNLRIISTLTTYLTRRWPKIKRFANVFSLYSRHDLLKVFLFSALRYMIFSLQFYFLLRIFHLDFNLFYGFLAVSLIFLGITVIPSIALAEVGIRGSVAVFVVNLFVDIIPLSASEGYQFNIIAVSTLLWIINIVIPSILGSGFIFSLSFFKSNKHNDY